MVDEVLSPLFTTAWGRRAGLGLFVLMCLLILFTAFQSLMTLYGDVRLVGSSAKSTVSSLATDQLAKRIASIPQWHLFGQYGAQSAILPVTSLQIHLVGVIKATPEKFSRVIISESNQPGKVYQVGDLLSATGVRIYAISPEGVVLDNSGRLEKLPLQRTPLVFQGMPKSLGDK